MLCPSRFSSQPIGPRAAARRPYAALDLGTNNCRLLVARAPSRRRPFRVVDAFSRIVRLGEGLAASGVLSEAAMDRTIEALKICAEQDRRHRVAGARSSRPKPAAAPPIATSSSPASRSETGIALEIITAEEEARLAVAGCAPLLDPRIPYALVFDIGGGSTELVWLQLPMRGRRRRSSTRISLPLGVVTLSDRYGGREVSAGDLCARWSTRSTRRCAFRGAPGHRRAHRRAARCRCSGSSGTVTTLAGVHLDLPRYNRRRVDGACCRFDDLRRPRAASPARPSTSARAIPASARERADLVLARLRDPRRDLPALAGRPPARRRSRRARRHPAAACVQG